MGNPYAPGRRVVGRESTVPLESMLMRLRRLGATAEELDEVAAHWDHFDEDWTPERRRAFERSTDDDLRDQLAAVREEWAAVQPDDEDRAWDDAVVAAATMIADGASVAAVVAWAGDDPMRRLAGKSAETSRTDRAPRVTLLDALDGPAD